MHNEDETNPQPVQHGTLVGHSDCYERGVLTKDIQERVLQAEELVAVGSHGVGYVCFGFEGVQWMLDG